MDILNDAEEQEDRYLKYPPSQPKSGDIYVFNSENGKFTDFLCDGYQWLNQGKHFIPRNAPIIEKRYFQRLIDGKKVDFKKILIKQVKDTLFNGILH